MTKCRKYPTCAISLNSWYFKDLKNGNPKCLNYFDLRCNSRLWLGRRNKTGRFFSTYLPFPSLGWNGCFFWISPSPQKERAGVKVGDFFIISPEHGVDQNNFLSQHFRKCIFRKWMFQSVFLESVFFQSIFSQSVFFKVYFSKVYLSKVYFCKMFLICASSKLWEFTLREAFLWNFFYFEKISKGGKGTLFGIFSYSNT